MLSSGPVVQSLLSAPHPRELGQSFDRDGSQRSTMLSAKVLPADPQRPERHHRLPTRESVHRGDTVPLHRVWWSQQPPVCGAASAGKHHSRWKLRVYLRVNGCCVGRPGVCSSRRVALTGTAPEPTASHPGLPPLPAPHVAGLREPARPPPRRGQGLSAGGCGLGKQ